MPGNERRRGKRACSHHVVVGEGRRDRVDIAQVGDICPILGWLQVATTLPFHISVVAVVFAPVREGKIGLQLHSVMKIIQEVSAPD